MWVTEDLGWIPAWLFYILILGLLLYLYGIWPYLTSPINLPGPKPVPFVGNMIQIFRTGASQMDMLCTKKYGRVYLSWRGRYPMINIADPDLVKQICVKEFSNFTNRKFPFPMSPVQKAMITVLEDDHWKFVRSVLTPAFSSSKMRKTTPMVQACICRLLENLKESCKKGKSFDVKSMMGGLTMEVIGAVGFGIEADVQKDLNDRFLTMANTVFSSNALTQMPVVMSFLFPFLKPLCEKLGMTTDSKEATEFFITLVNNTIEERRRNRSPRKDFLQLILDSSVEDVKETLADKDVDWDALKMDEPNRNKLSDTEAVAQAFAFLIAGYRKTTSGLSFFAYNMAIYPDCQNRLIREIDDVLQGAAPTYDNVMTLPYLDMCLSETQRLYPAFNGVRRVARESVTLKGVHIPAGTSVLLLGYALQRDKAYWPDPEKFDPERWTPEQKTARHPYVYFPFGVGPRNCVGMRLGQMETKMAIVAILQKFRFVRAPETVHPLRLTKSVFIQAENGVWLRVESRV